MLHLGDMHKREEKYYRFVYTDTYLAIKQSRAVDHNSSFKDALCLPQLLSLIKMPSVCNLVLAAKLVNR